jgi:RNA polymerase sigma factor (sigma-70 family)
MSATSTASAQPGRPNTPVIDFIAHYAGLLRFLTRRTGCADTARDLAHDTWLRLAERHVPAEADAAPTPREAPRDERAYLYTVAAHLASNWQRHARRGDERFVSDATSDLAQAQAAGGDVAHTHAMREAVRAVEQALQSLPQRRRDIFLAHRLDGAPHDTLAQQHGVSVKTVEREVMQSMDAVHAALLQWRGDVGPASPNRPTRGRRSALSALLGFAGVSTAGVWAWQWWRHGVAQFQLALSTPKARLLRRDLPDGSQITLDADSRAEVAFYADRRQVGLVRGSAFFAVARESARPFVVETRLAHITVLGTRFEVEAGADEVVVAVESGRVRVHALRPAGDARSVTLEAGERMRVSAAVVQALADPAASASRSVAAWREGWLDFHGVPLAAAAQRLARYTEQPIRVAHGAAQLSVLGRVRISDAATWLRLLPQMLPVRVRQRDGGWEIEPR